MTNAEKFAEVFGTDLKRQYITKSWWDQEFVPDKTIQKEDDKCQECQKDWTKCTTCPEMMKWVKEHESEE